MTHEHSSEIATAQIVPETSPEPTHDGMHSGVVVADRYTLERRLGMGAFGVVWSCIDSAAPNESVAIKLFTPSVVEQEQQQQRFLRELELARRIQHPNVCHIRDAGHSGAWYYLTMDLVPGQSLRQRLGQGRIPVDVALLLIYEVIAAVQAAHERQVLHGDLKPENIMVRPDGHIVVVDFGLARSLLPGIASTQSITGTPQYMSPEQLRGEPLDERSDIFALGLLLRELLTGVAPIDTDPTAPLALPEFDRQTVLGLEQLLKRALASQRNARFPSIRSFAAALTDALRAHLATTAGTHPRSLAAINSALLRPGHAHTLGELTPPEDWHGETAPMPPQAAAVNSILTTQSDHIRQVADFAPIEPLPTESPDASTRYMVEGEHARGGSGRIVKARDLRLDRQVAIKLLLKSSRNASTRFMREAMVSARLQHPSIVPVYDVGRWPSGEPFYTMKLISGRSLRELIEQAEGLDHRLALLPHVVAVADAMAYAHSHNIIHRDLKPANVLVGDFGETVVIDWGLAKDLREASLPSDPDSEVDAGTSNLPSDVTNAGVVLGTPHYMPLEQALAQSVDERVDVYSIGAILLHLLTGRLPYEGRTAREVLAQVRAHEPPILGALPHGIPKDLATIVRKAMARQRDHRYPTAKELAEDLRRFLTGQLVSAHEYSRRTLIGRWLKRNRIPLLIAGLCLGVLSLSGLFAIRKIVHERNIATHERQRAEDKSRIAQERADELLLVQARSSLESDPTAALAWLKSIPPGRGNFSAMREVALDAWTRGGIAWHILRKGEGRISYSAFSPDSRLVAFADDARGLSVREVATGKTMYHLDLSGELNAVRFAPDGQTLAFSEWQRTTLKLWKPASSNLYELSGHDGEIASFRLSPDGHFALVGSPSATLRLWPLPQGPSRALTGHKGLGFAIRFSHDSRWVAYPGTGAIHLVDLHTGQQRSLVTDDPLELELAPDGSLLAASGSSGDLWLWNLATGQRQVLRGHTRVITAFAFSSDSRFIASTSYDRTIRLWDLATGSSHVLGEHQREALAVAFSPDDSIVASAGADAQVQLFWRHTGDHRVLRGHQAAIYTVEFSPAGNVVMSVSADQTTRLWRLPPDPARILRSSEVINRIRFSPDGQHIAAISNDNLVRWWTPATGQLREWAGHEALLRALAISPDGQRVATGGLDRAVRLWDVTTGQSRVLRGHRTSIAALAFSPDGAHLASASVDGAIWLWNLPSGEGHVIQGHFQEVHSLAFSPDSQLLASASSDHTLRLWSLNDAKSRILQGHSQEALRVVFSPDGQSLASASGDGTVRLWDLSTGHMQILARQSKRVHAVDFSPDGRLLAAAGEDREVQLCVVSRGTCQGLLGHAGAISELAFSPDGHLLASVSNDSTVRTWDTRSATCIELHRHQAKANEVAFSPDGEHLLTASSDKTARLWRVHVRPDVPVTDQALRRWLDQVTSAVITPDNTVASGIR